LSNSIIPDNSDNLSALSSLMQESIASFRPSEFSSYAAQWKQEFWNQYNCANGLYIKMLIDIGANYIDFNNNELAEYYLDEASLCISDIYGAESFLAKYILRFYALIDYLQGNYSSCIEYAESALVAIYEMTTSSVPQQFFDIYEGRDEHFDNIYVLSFRARTELSNISGDESVPLMEVLLKVLISSKVNKNNASNLIEAAFEEQGIPPHIYRMIKTRLFQSVHSLRMKEILPLTKAMASMWWKGKNWEGKDVEQVASNDRIKAIEAYFKSYTSMARIFGEENLIGKLLNASVDNLIFTFLPGYIKLGYPQKTIEYYELNQDIPMNAKGALIALLWKCIAYDQLNDYENVQNCLEIILESYRHIVSQMLFVFDEVKQIEFLSVFQLTLFYCLYLLTKHRGIEFSYTFYISYKMLSYDFNSISKRYLKDHPKYQEIIHLKNQTADAQIKHEIRQKQAELLEEINDADVYNELFNVTMSDLYRSIGNDCILIEFAPIYRDIEHTAYGAFIINGSEKISYVELAISDFVDEHISVLLESIEKAETNTDIFSMPSYKYIDKNIISPLLDHCSPEKRTILLSPVGKLFVLPFELFFPRDQQITYIDSGRELAKAKSNPSVNQNIICGNIAIGTPDTVGYDVLPTSLYEVEKIAELLHCPSVVRHEVNKSIFDKAYKYMHLSTHGDYIPDEDILAASYLILSNGERISAKELSLKDFSGTELVTLAACKSGIGLETTFEGTLGIRRSFINAGAKNVIASLWKVPDVATTILMIQFYKNLIVRNMRIYDALNQAKHYLRDLSAREIRDIFESMSDKLSTDTISSLLAWTEDSSPEEKLFKAPYYWASFILVTS